MNTINTCVGIDLARRSNHKAVLTQEGGNGRTNSKRAFSFAHDLEGLNALVYHILKRTGKDSLKGIGINMEPTSGVWETVAAFLDKQGAEVFYTRTDVVSALRKAQNKFTKTDRIDASTLAGLARSMPERMIPFKAMEERIRSLRSLSAQRQSVAEDIVRWKNRFIAKIEIVWHPLLEHLDKGERFGKTVRAFLSKFVDPRRVVKYGYQRLENWFWQNAHGNTDPELFQTLWSGAEKSAGLLEEMERLGALNVNVEVFEQLISQDLRFIANYEKEISRIEDQIKTARKSVPECDVVQELPGVGDVISVTISSLLLPVERFANAKKLGAYTGYTSRKKQSADREIKGLKITKTGNRRLKRDLVLAADTAMHSDPQVAAFAIRLLQKGKHYNKVRVAVGRKIAVRAYSLLKRYCRGEKNIHYIWRNLEGKTITKEEAKLLAKNLWSAYEVEKA